MRYPTIDQYIDALCEAKVFAKSLPDFTFPLSCNGIETYSSGNFGVVFLAHDKKHKPFAIKCFTRNQWGRKLAYTRLCRHLPKSEYLVKMKYLTEELCVAPYGSEVLIDYDVISMEYVDGVTLSEKVAEAVADGDTNTLGILSNNFDRLAIWLLDNSFAHGDLKPDNIMVLSDLSLKLIDYDGFYIEEMAGESQRECGTVAFQHPLRSAMPFCRDIDDYSIAVLSLSLRAFAADTEAYTRFCFDSSSFVIEPSEAVLDSSMALFYIEECRLVDSELIEAVKSPTAKIEDLRYIIESTFREVELKAVDKIEFAKPVQVGAKWGYMNSCGKMLTRLMFERAWEFTSDGLAMVKKGEKYGFVGTDCKMAISAKYDYASSFNEGTAVVAIGRKYGYIDTRGRWKVKPQYDFARPSRGGIAEVDLDGKQLRIKL